MKREHAGLTPLEFLMAAMLVIVVLALSMKLSGTDDRSVAMEDEFLAYLADNHSHNPFVVETPKTVFSMRMNINTLWITVDIPSCANTKIELMQSFNFALGRPSVSHKSNLMYRLVYPGSSESFEPANDEIKGLYRLAINAGYSRYSIWKAYNERKKSELLSVIRQGSVEQSAPVTP